MPALIKKRDNTPVRLALLAYQEKGLVSLQELFQNPGLAGRFQLETGDLGSHNGTECDIAVSVFSNGDKIEAFISDIASLRYVKNIPIVFAVVTESARPVFLPYQEEVPTHNILQLPMLPEEFNKAIMTSVVNIKLKDGKKGDRVDFNEHSKFLGSILVEHGIITPLQLKRALDYQRGSDQRLGDVLVTLNFITEVQKIQFLAGQLGVDIATPKQFASADLNLIAIIPEHVARRHRCIALEKAGSTLIVAMEDVLDLRTLDSLRDITDLAIKPILATSSEIGTSIERFYRDISSQRDASELIDNMGGDVEYVEQKSEEVDIEEATAAGAELGIIKLVNILIANAIRDRASDIHIEPMEHALAVRYRIDGDLKKVMSPPKAFHLAIVARIKILSQLDIAERRLPQDGRMVVKIRHREVDIRVSILPSVFGEKAVLRILDKEAFEKSVSNLGFNERNRETFRSQIAKPYGMVIVTGPTGSGKSTTLYSAIQQIKNVTRNIVTVEDPVEFHMSGITQVHINTKIDLTFGNALRAILRQDPDIILIGEIRDQETADIAIKMALTGHLVFSTLHTNDAASTISRFVDIGIPPLLLGSSLNLIIAQRLVRRICPNCKKKYTPAPELLEQLNLKQRQNFKFFKGEGCVSCNGTGYFGRTGLFEMLDISTEIRKMILKNAPTMEIQKKAVQEGMQTLRQAGMEKVLAGETTIEQVIAVSTES
jgi:type IV pilus assembly protein PilB